MTAHMRKKTDKNSCRGSKNQREPQFQQTLHLGSSNILGKNLSTYMGLKEIKISYSALHQSLLKSILKRERSIKT